MSLDDILTWGESHHYPFLRIGDEADPLMPDVLRHGRKHYEELRISGVRQCLASKRIARWDAMFGEYDDHHEDDLQDGSERRTMIS